MTELVPLNPDDAFAFADRIAQSPLLPDAYRNKPTEVAIAIMYGHEVGLPPMTSLQRIVVIGGKPTLDAQGMVALIRSRGHSLTGDASTETAEVVGTRADNGDTMKVNFTIADAKRAGLVRQNSPWTKFPKSMLWARAVSQLARELFADVLLGMSYVPEEMEAVTGVKYQQGQREMLTPNNQELYERERPFLEEGGQPDQIVAANTGEIIDLTYPQREIATDTLVSVTEAKDGLRQIIQEVVPEDQRTALRAYLVERFGAAADLTLEQIEEATTIAAGWPVTGDNLWGGEPF